MGLSRHLVLLGAPLALLAGAMPASSQAASVTTVHTRLLPLDAHLDIDATFDSAAVPATTDGPTQFDLVKAKRGGSKR